MPCSCAQLGLLGTLLDVTEASQGPSVHQQTLRSKPVPLLWKLQWEHLGIGEGGADADESRFLTLIPDGMQLLLHGRSWKPLGSPYLSQVLGSSCSFHGSGRSSIQLCSVLNQTCSGDWAGQSLLSNYLFWLQFCLLGNLSFSSLSRPPPREHGNCKYLDI